MPTTKRELHGKLDKVNTSYDISYITHNVYICGNEQHISATGTTYAIDDMLTCYIR